MPVGRDRDACGPRIVFHKEAAPLVFLANDPAHADSWTRQTPGAPADGEERVTRLRGALHQWLTNDRDTRTVGALFRIHPNTIKYRVGKVLELLRKARTQTTSTSGRPSTTGTGHTTEGLSEL